MRAGEEEAEAVDHTRPLEHRKPYGQSGQTEDLSSQPQPHRTLPMASANPPDTVGLRSRESALKSTNDRVPTAP